MKDFELVLEENFFFYLCIIVLFEFQVEDGPEIDMI